MTIQFIQLKSELVFEEVAGRETRLLQGAHGVLLTEESLGSLKGLSIKDRLKCLSIMKEASRSDSYAALVCGYPCVLNTTDFINTHKPKISTVPAEII